ncbi:MAG: hypothetical protein IJ054_02940 [Lachnospiraceae bacterium]|nr:hypothetical protein [Lachnospiraceae bacterium]
MEEKILNKGKNGMAMLMLILLLFCGGIALVVVGALYALALIALGVLAFVLSCFLMPGLKILKPQEALVLTLFGKYLGTLKGDGFFFVNPFCVAVNPASSTKLNQSGDVKDNTTIQAATTASLEIANKKMSLKIMTLNNNKQKINDCLGNPIEIGIAVTWKIVDTAKAAFNVDNYKEYLSLQCDAALRNIVRIYPYDVAPNVDTTGD